MLDVYLVSPPTKGWINPATNRYWGPTDKKTKPPHASSIVTVIVLDQDPAKGSVVDLESILYLRKYGNDP